MSSKRCVCAVCTRLLFFSFSKPQIDERERERLAKEQADLAARAVVGRLPNQTARLSMQKMSLVRGTNVLPPVGELQSSGNGSSAQTGGNTAFFNNLMAELDGDGPVVDAERESILTKVASRPTMIRSRPRG